MINLIFCFNCRSVGTFARALDCSSSVKQPSLHMSAAAASRDITLVSLVIQTLQVNKVQVHISLMLLGYQWLATSSLFS